MDSEQKLERMATWLKVEFSNALTNRSETTEKWNRNLESWLGRPTKHWKLQEGEGWRSSRMGGHVRQKVTTGVALIVDQLLQGAKMPFMLAVADEGQTEREDLPQEEQDAGDEARQRMERLIHQQLEDGDAERELLRNVLAGAMLGETYARKGVRTVQEHKWEPEQVAGIQDFGRVDGSVVPWKRVTADREIPAWEYVTNWSMLFDTEPGRFADAAFTTQYNYVSPYWLRQRKSDPHFRGDDIDKVLTESAKEDEPAEGVSDDDLSPALRKITNRKNNILYVERYGRVPRQLVDDFEKSSAAAENGADAGETLADNKNDGDEVEVMVATANWRVVRFARTSAYDRPHSRVVWQESLDSSYGVSVSDNCEQMADMIIQAFRAFEDNANWSSNGVTIMKPEMIQERVTKLFPGIVLHAEEDVEDAQKAMQHIKYPDIGKTLTPLIHMAVQFLDEDSMIPRVSQGVSTREDKKTAYETSVIVEKSSKYIGQVLKNYDQLLEEMLTWYLDFNMTDPECTCTGNYKVKALGFSGFQARRERIEKLQKFLEIVAGIPELARRFKLDEIGSEIAKSLDMDSDQYEKSEDELARDAQAAADSPERKMELAKAEADIEKSRAEAEAKRTGAETDMAKVELEAAKAEVAAEVEAVPV